MSPEKQRIAIAKACGLNPVEVPFEPNLVSSGHNGRWFAPDAAKTMRDTYRSCATPKVIPDYLNDLNAMHEAEKTLTHEEKTDYIRILNNGDFGYRRLAFATSKQRAEAFLITIFQWERE